MNRIRPLYCLALLLAGFTASAQNWPSINLNEINPDRFKTTIITVQDDPVYKMTKRYQGYSLAEIIKSLKIPKTYSAEAMFIVFTAKDGYRVAMAYNDAVKEQGYIAFKDTEAAENKSWVNFKLGKQTETPAPFYLVWTQQGLDKWRYPWPFQLTSISLEPAAAYAGAAAPQHPDTETTQGFNLFSLYCIRCHSVNLSGGHLGPELNVPQNITEYFIEKKLPGFILNAPAYRAGTRMPAFVDTLDAGQIQSIVHYLRHMKTEKIQVEQ